jgi:hypothetical protein
MNHGKRPRDISIFPIILALSFTIVGCAQNTETTSDQKTDQETAQTTAQDTSQETATARDGLRNAVVILTHPRGYGKANADGIIDESDPEGAAAANAPRALDDAPPGNYSVVIGDISITNTDGSTGVTPTQTGTAEGAATGTQTGALTATATATQDVDAKVAIDLAAALAPGGVIDQALAASAAGGQGTATLDKQSQQELRSLLQGGKMTPAALETLIPVMLDLLADQQAQPQPQPQQPATGP